MISKYSFGRAPRGGRTLYKNGKPASRKSVKKYNRRRKNRIGGNLNLRPVGGPVFNPNLLRY